MRCKLALAFVALSGIASALPAPTHAQALWVPVIPPEIGVGPPPARYGWIPFRCTDEVPNNFYHGAYYGGQPPALYRGYAYRPFYRYTAYRVTPRTYFCVDP
jgi:hypothetical protein